MTFRNEIQVTRVSPFKHAVVHEGVPYLVKQVVKTPHRVAIVCENALVLIHRPVDSITVELVTNDDPDPVEPSAAQTVARRAAKPPWRMGRSLHRHWNGTLPPR